MLCILSFLLNSTDVGLNGISASIKNDINLEPTAKWQRRSNCLPCVYQVFPRLWKRNRRTSPSLWKEQLELLRSKTLILGWAATLLLTLFNIHLSPQTLQAVLLLTLTQEHGLFQLTCQEEQCIIFQHLSHLKISRSQ